MTRSTKVRLASVICSIFLFFQMSVNIYEYFVSFVDIKIPLKYSEYYLNLFYYHRLIKKSKEVATHFSLATIIVTGLSISLFSWLHFGSFRKISKWLQRNEKCYYLSYVYGILISVTIRTLCNLCMSPIKIFRFSSICTIFIQSIFYVNIQRILFQVHPISEPVFFLLLDLKNLFYLSRILRSLPLENEYKSISKEVLHIMKHYKLNVEVFYGSNSFGFLTFYNGLKDIIVLGPQNGIFSENELKSVLLHEIYHIIDKTVLKKQILKVTLLIIYTFFKIMIINQLTSRENNKRFIDYSIHSYSLFITVFYMTSIIEHYFLQIKEEQSDIFSKINGGGEDLANWILKYNVTKSIPLHHTRIFNLTYYTHPTVIDRLKYLD